MPTRIVITIVLVRVSVGALFVLLGWRHLTTLRYERVWRRARAMNGIGDRFLRDRIRHCRNLTWLLAMMTAGSSTSLVTMWATTYIWWHVLGSAFFLVAVLVPSSVILDFMRQRRDLWRMAQAEVPEGAEVDPYKHVGIVDDDHPGGVA
jgi:hypothetical protein